MRFGISKSVVSEDGRFIGTNCSNKGTVFIDAAKDLKIGKE